MYLNKIPEDKPEKSNKKGNNLSGYPTLLMNGQNVYNK